MAGGWQGRHTLDVPVVVVTHRTPTDWVEAHPDAFFGPLSSPDGLLGDPTVLVQGDRVIHLVFPVQR